LEPHLDLLCQTSPEPNVSPDPALYIHGPRRDFPEVGVVLRNDLDGLEDPLAVLCLTPPLATETATVPLYLAKMWLSKPASGNDESGDEPMLSPEFKAPTNFERLPIWRKGEPLWLDNPDKLSPGDTLILPLSRRENIRNLLPLPENTGDQYEEAHLHSRDRIAIRFTQDYRGRLAMDLPEESRGAFLEITAPCFSIPEAEETWRFDAKTWKTTLPRLAALLAEHLPAGHVHKALWQHAAWINKDPRNPRELEDWKFTPYPPNSHFGAILSNKSRCGATPWPLEPADLGQQGNEARSTITLSEHSIGVAQRCGQNARHLPAPLQKGLHDAALLHDLGKLDPRFQALLYGCLLHALGGSDPLAKSDRAFSPAAEKQLRQALNLPDGFRHELVSAKIVADAEAWRHHPERDLVLHLIASHHGRCRCFAPVVFDEHPEPFEVTTGNISTIYVGHSSPMAALTDGVPSRFWLLIRRFGWWGLPYLESLLRLADQTESASPSRI
jgi:CRISPR-associated endonuclease/helicase Cas3